MIAVQQQFRPLMLELAPTLALLDSPEREGKITPQEIGAMLVTFRRALGSILDTSDTDAAPLRHAADRFLVELERYSLIVTMRDGRLMLDSDDASRSTKSGE